MPDPTPCEHKILAFTSGGLYVICFDCAQSWMAIKANNEDGYRYTDPVVAREAAEHGLTLADKRLAVNPVSLI